MRVYRNNLEAFNSSQYFPVYEIDGVCYAKDRVTKSHLQPKNGVIVKTGSKFEKVSVSIDIEADKYYRLDGSYVGTDELLWTEIDAQTASDFATLAVFDIMEATYTGDDMGERKVVANIKYPTPIGFRIGDYVEIAIQSLTKNDTTIKTERFYIYNEPQCKKIARPMAAGDSFETIVTFYPPQYELGCIVLRDSIQEQSNLNNIIYTGFDTVVFEGGAFALLTRCVACMNAQFVDNDGKGLWSFDLAETLNEDTNRALERYLFSFSKTSVADALLKLNDSEQINTTFFINGRTIYAGYKRSYVCKVDPDMGITDVPMKFAYGKTSHLPVDHDRGLLKNIFKTIGEEVPITKLFAYGSTRNINRYYCADLIASGRYVNKLMLPSFSNDGHTDFIISEDGVKKFGIRESSKEFENIYPSIQHMTYADIRGVKYCIKIKASGDKEDTKLESGLYEKNNTISKYAVARVQCYKVTPCMGNAGVNTLVPCAPPEDLVVTIRATGKVVKCILRGGNTNQEAIDKQIVSDGKWGNGNGRVPATSFHGDEYIPGSCFCVHDNHFQDGEGKTYQDSERDKWFIAPTTATTDSASELHRMEYVDTMLITDVYAFDSYQQTHYRRDGYSAGCWARINNNSGFGDTLLINEVVAVESIVITDTDSNKNSNQKTWDLYLRDLGFSPDEQNDFGDRVFVFDTIKVSFLDGLLTGREFTIAGSMTDNQDVCVCAYNNDGTLNKYFFEDSGYTDGSVPETAFAKGAIWRFRLNRLNDEELENLGIIIPTKTLCAKEGDHVTLLDIYMPDVYVRAAENRLLKEAMKYLRHNDKGDVKYTAEFDQVRINQIPNYALQMREGVRVRLVDDDLNITTENTTRKIVDYPNGLDSQVSMFTIEQNVTTETVMTFFRFQPDVTDIWNQYDSFESHVTSFIEESNRCTISLPRNGGELSSVEAVDVFVSPQARFSLDRKMVGYTQYPLNILTTSAAGENWLITFECTKEMYNLFIEDYRDIQVELYENVITTESYKYSNKGQRYYAIPDEIIDFTSGKFYDVVLDVESAFAGNQIEFLLCKSKDVESTKYIPAYTITELAETGVKEGFTRIKVSFFLDDSFDDSVGYYSAVKYIADGNTEYTSIRLLSVTEKDVDEDDNILNYADVTVDHVTVKITDNTRGANTRILNSYPEPIREIQATFNSNKKASSWAKVMSRVVATEQEVEARKTTFQSIINDARRNYRALLSLRNSIFDPDSNTNDKCDYNFLRVMMMQVGADSMNYLLDKTYQSADGAPHNYSISRLSDTSNPVFNVNSIDRLSHLVYVQSGENGHWTIPAPFSQTLQPNDDGSWSPYFVCIRCRKDGANALDEQAWICSKHQYAVNQDVNPETGLTTDQYGNLMTDYWYFNWAILTCPENDGNYVLRETRGNAYMYGDSLICGKISSLAQNSYFDLNTGNFVLGGNKDGSAALSYIDGVLTISGLPDEDKINDLIEEINKINNLEIGGENIIPDSEEMSVSLPMSYPIGEFMLTPHSDEDSFVAIKAGTYVFSAENAKCVWYGQKYGGDYSSYIPFNCYLKATYTDGTYGEMTQIIAVNDSSIKDISFTIEKEAVISLVVSYNPSAIPEDSIVERVTITLTNVMLQKGNKSTSYQQYVKHITAALQGSTEIAGGLVMTNLLMLKDTQNRNDGTPVVTAGMSGKSDDGVLIWGGGSYLKAIDQAKGVIESLYDMLPVLLTKTGIGSRIGCLRVLTSTQVSVDGVDGSQILIDASAGSITAFDADGNAKIEITSKAIDKNTADIQSFSKKSYDSWTLVSDSEQTSLVFYQQQLKNNGYYKINCETGLAKIYMHYRITFNGYYAVSDVKVSFKIQVRSGGTSKWTFATVSNYSMAGGSSYLDGYLSMSASVGIPTNARAPKINNNVEIGIYDAVAIGTILGTTPNTRLQFAIKDIWFGYGTVTNTGGGTTPCDVQFSMATTDKTIIGSNGIQVQSENGLVQILNDSDKTYIRATNLPTDSDTSSLDTGQLYIHDLNFSTFTDKLAIMISESFVAAKKNDYSSRETDMINALPNQKCISIK